MTHLKPLREKLLRLAVPLAFAILNLIAQDSFAQFGDMTFDRHLEGKSPITHSFQVGAAEEDITPWPGLSMGGHGPSARESRGVALRLWSHAIYVDDGNGNALVLVSADLWSMPQGLADSVASMVHHDSEMSFLGRPQFLFAATHTHHSPGNFSSAPQYNMFASNSIFFDEHLFQFLVVRIARSILAAYRDREQCTMLHANIDIPGMVRNRSMNAFRLDPEAAKWISANPKLVYDTRASAIGYPDKDCYRGVDDTLEILAFRSVQSREYRGIAAFFASHPTSISSSSNVYSSDFYGYASRAASEELEGHPVVALFNGAEGDVSPNFFAQDWTDCVRLGSLLASNIVRTTKVASGVKNPEVSWHYEEINIPASDGSVAKRAEMGHRTLGGAEDGRNSTFVDEIECSDCMETDNLATDASKEKGQPPKIPSVNRLSGVKRIAMEVAAPYSPQVVPIGIYSIGKFAIVSLPGEFTTILGGRVRNGVHQKLPGYSVLLAGLSNEYLSYFTTSSEYDLQQYEASSNLWGKFAGDFLASSIVRVASKLGSPSILSAARTDTIGLVFDPRAGLPYIAKSTDPFDSLSVFLPNGSKVYYVGWEDNNIGRPENTLTLRRPVEPDVLFSYRTNGIVHTIRNSENSGIVIYASTPGIFSSEWYAFWLVPANINPTDVRCEILTLRGDLLQASATGSGKGIQLLDSDMPPLQNNSEEHRIHVPPLNFDAVREEVLKRFVPKR